MKTIILLIATLQAAFLRVKHTKTVCAEKIKFDGVELFYSESEMAYTNGETKLAQNPADKTWMMISPDSDPLVSFDKGQCVDDNLNWFRLDMSVFKYRPVTVSILEL